MSPFDKLTQNIELLPDIIAEYEALIEEETVKEHLLIKGKNLETANTEHASWSFYYNTRKAEMYSIVKWFEGKLHAKRGKFFKRYTENYSRELTDRVKDKYIDNEKEVLDQLELYLQVKELHEKYVAVCDAFTVRGFALRNITELRIRSLEDSII